MSALYVVNFEVAIRYSNEDSEVRSIHGVFNMIFQDLQLVHLEALDALRLSHA